MSVANGDANEPETSIFTSTSSTIEWSQPCRAFEFGEILFATEHFKESLVVGRGGFGKVYKAKIVTGSGLAVAAIKRSDSASAQGESEFWAEVEVLGRLRHCHLVSLIGYCKHENDMHLIYEYIPNGTLHEHLHEVRTRLSWIQRLKICIDVARGLDYLHTGTSNRIIHRDVTSSNIMLNQCWTAKITDLGLSKSIPMADEQKGDEDTIIKGTFGYIDPHYFLTGMLTKKSDVYSFGVVMLEVLCRKTPYNRETSNYEEEQTLAKWALLSIKEGRLEHIIDSDIKYEISPNCLKGFVQITERCLDDLPNHRPTMAEVLLALESVLNLQQETNNLLLIAGKTKFGTRVHTLSETINNNSGMEFGFRIPKKRKLLILREKILHKLGTRISFKDKLKFNSFGSIKIFQAQELKKATNNYAQDRILGRGAQGIVYKGILQNMSVVAIKRHRILSQSRLEQLITEIVILEQVNHKNVVSLLGCCFTTETALLVYEYVSKGTLHHAIHHGTSALGIILSWDDRLRIARGSAYALAYLHKHVRVSIVHRDVKSANILLDENYTPKIIDFGSSLLIPLDHDQVAATDIQGTLGYLDPEYVNNGQLTRKADVYGFGVVLSELLTGKKAFDGRRDEEDRNLSTYFVREHVENRLHLILDPVVLEQATDTQLSAARDLVRKCLEPSHQSRPTMEEVAVELETLMIA